MQGHFKLKYDVLNWTAPNQTTLKWTVQSQIKACTAISSCEICALTGYQAA